jgi:DNA-binding transcriptional ArsR family regulator
MGITKTDVYTDEQNELADLLKAIAHPARIAILQKLCTVDCCICRDFSEDIDLSQPTISRHLGELKAAGLISGTISGTTKSYCLNPERWKAVSSLIGSFLGSLRAGANCC